MKLLIGIPSPRDIPAFRLAIDTIPHDKIWVKYMGYQHDPYGQLKDFFMQHDEYTHFAICQDDMMVHPKGVATLIEDAKIYPVISACFNVEKNDFECPWRTSWPIGATKNLPTIKLPRNYDWFTWGELKKLGRYVPVKHSGKGFAIIPRDIMKKLSFQGDKGVLSSEKPSAYDLGISHELQQMGIQEYVDTEVFFAHFRYGGKIMNNKLPAELWFEKVGEKRQVLKPLDRMPFGGQTKSSVMQS